MENNYDVVIIGSGLGGLECGLILAKEGFKVCVLEQAQVFGGCLQSFMRRGRSIDTGIHYVGSMDDGQIMRQYFKYFGILDDLSLIKLDADFDIISFGNQGQFAYNSGYDNFFDSLSRLFPYERMGLKKYCQKIREIGSSISVDVHRSGSFSLGGIEYLSLSAVGFINQCVTDPLLRNILAGTNLLYGGIRDKSNLYHHAMINHSNIEGAYRFVGGTQKVADLMVERIVSSGGVAMNRSKVVSVNVEQGRVLNVDLEGGERIFGKYFISNLHPSATFSLIGETPFVKKAYRSRLNMLPNTYGLFSVYLLMKPDTFPYINKNYYYFYSDDAWDTVMDGGFQPRSVMLSTQLGQPGRANSDVVTLMSPVDSSLFSRWNNTSIGKRGSDYLDLKDMITSRIIDFTSSYWPNLKDSVDYVLAASPLTYSDYTGTPQGSAYGIVKDFHNPLASLFPARTRLENLFLTGQNLNVHGALGVTLTAATTCAELVGANYLAKKIGNA
jgi:phytoene dehydrogenase-like protein